MNFSLKGSLLIRASKANDKCTETASNKLLEPSLTINSGTTAKSNFNVFTLNLSHDFSTNNLKTYDIVESLFSLSDSLFVVDTVKFRRSSQYFVCSDASNSTKASAVVDRALVGILSGSSFKIVVSSSKALFLSLIFVDDRKFKVSTIP